MKTKLIKIEKCQGIQIYLNPQNERYIFTFQGKEHEGRSLFEMKNDLVELLEERFEKDYFYASYDGIRKFKAQRKRKDKIIGIEIDRYGSEREEFVDPKDLYPVSEYNKQLFEEGLRLNKEGWALIEKAKKLTNKLKK